MYTGRTRFSQVMDFVPWTSFNRIVAKYRGDRDTRTLRCPEHFRVMAFAQVTYRESLRDIEACLGAQPAKLCSMGLRGPIAKSTLADANELRDWRIWSDLAAVLIKRARKLYLKDAGAEVFGIGRDGEHGLGRSLEFGPWQGLASRAFRRSVGPRPLRARAAQLSPEGRFGGRGTERILPSNSSCQNAPSLAAQSTAPARVRMFHIRPLCEWRPLPSRVGLAVVNGAEGVSALAGFHP
jgi:hypothetical protein